MSVSYDVIPVGAYEANCVILFGTDKNAWIVDPGDEAEVITAHLRRKTLVPRRILLTHGHLDHISALNDLLAAWPGLPVMAHAADADWCFTDDRNRLPGYGAPPTRPASLAFYAEGDTISDGGLSAVILHTPGHSPGSVCIRVSDGPLVSGDTLFARSIGRTDFPGGSVMEMAKSLRRLSQLDGGLTVIPGHGPATTMGDEIKWNPYLQM